MTSAAIPHVIPEHWELDIVLKSYSGMRLVPTGGDRVVLAGDLSFSASSAGLEVIDDIYSIKMQIPRSYPKRGLPRVFEMAGRIPRSHHRHADSSLCLGAPSRLRMIALKTPSIAVFIDEAVVPYLFGQSYYERHKRRPFGELAHGDAGLAEDLIAMIGMPRGTDAVKLAKAASMRKRHANKQPCPCDGERRLGRCHNRAVNLARAMFGRGWFAGEWRRHAER